MSTFVLLVVAVAVAGVITYILMKKGTIADANNNNIPDAIEEKVEEVKVVVKKAKAITPVPGGVGPVTIACLLNNTLKAFKNIN